MTRLDRENEKGKNNKELKANHKIIRKINKKFTIYCSPGHFKKFLSNNNKYNNELKKFLLKHQVKKKISIFFRMGKKTNLQFGIIDRCYIKLLHLKELE